MVKHAPVHDATEETALMSLRGVTCYWNEVTARRRGSPDATSLLLAVSDVTLECTKATLTCIIGSVGSGKSALLQAMVGEIPVSSGSLVRNYDTIAYAPQDTFVMNGTVRENITMGLDWNEEWYNKVVEATGLTIDFKQFRNGDMTVVGDRGVQCSGGQRARIGLARALYRDADILICDDPLSAVDAKVGRQIFFDALMGLAVDRGKCVILATHQHQYVNEARCVLMKGGKVQCIGSYDECVNAAGGSITAHAPDTSIDNLVDSNDEPVKEDIEENAGSKITESDPIFKDDGDEMNVTGDVRYATFRNYVEAMGGASIGIFGLLLFAVAQGAVLLSVAMLGKWAGRQGEDQRSWDILGVIIGLGCSVVVLALFRALLSFHYTIKASQSLHDRMTKAVLRAKIEFFDTNPLGRILNRFSADVGSNDDLLPHTLFDFLVSAFFCLGSLATAVAVLPFTLIAVPPLVWYFLTVRRIFLTTTRELKRLEGLARSPIFAMMSESLSGISSIRANGVVEFFEKKFVKAQDAHSRAFFAFIASSRWVGFRMDSIVSMFIAFSCFLGVLFSQQGWLHIDPNVLGLAVTMLLQLASLFQWCVRQSAEVTNQMVSVERVLAFGDLPAEADLEMDGDEKLKDWPQNGSMTVADLSARYRSTLPLSLEKVSFEVPTGSHIGVVGRTGSGKSTLVQCLFRLLEPEEGSIKLSGVDISTVGLHTLRTRISVIPQMPVLFSGCTIRENLDPFSRYEDSAIEDVLRDVHMWQVVHHLPNGWSSFVSEGGSNFSVGQRQLLCLARAILCKNRFLVLDEPTANVDRQTDQLLHNALHKSFPSSTILSVAHRLDTIIENDFILVLGGGRVLEFGSPSDLLEKDGHFASMVHESGDAMSQDLRRRAREAKTKRNSLVKTIQ
jgi:ATP-binding cassette subfamily C (CFTR/MRP) protein 4